jgi:hypothetical protein
MPRLSLTIWCGRCRDIVPYDRTLYHKGDPYPCCKRCGNALLALEETVVAPCTLCYDENVEPPAEGMLVRGTWWLARERKIVPVRMWVCEQHAQEFEQVTRYEYPKVWSQILAWRALQAKICGQ